MYSEGEHKYLQDLDCVNIVKSIRQLKALMRIMLTQQQQQLIAFEREKVYCQTIILLINLNKNQFKVRLCLNMKARVKS